MCSLQPEVVANRGYELRLIRCTLNPSPPSDPSHEREPLDGLIKDLLNSIECGNYVEALTSQPSSSLVFRLGHDSPPLDTAERFYSELVDRAESFIGDASPNAGEQARRAILVMCIAVAAFLGFTQCNFTGPLKGSVLPRCPLPVDGGDERVEWDNWARNQLMSAGSDLLGKFSNLQYIVFAKMLLVRMKDLSIEIRSLSWWLARVLLLQQRILDERSSSLFDLLQVYMGEALRKFDTSEQVQSYWDADLRDGESLTIVSMLHVEAGIMEYVYGRVDSCRTHFESAELAAGLQLSVTGVLGFRTVHQAEPKAQMVLVTNTSSSNNADNCRVMGAGIQTHDSNNGEYNWHLHQCETSEASDILRIPKLLDNVDDSNTRTQAKENGACDTPSLSATQQAVILAYCTLIEKSSRHDELQRWDMAPYIEAIDSQHLFYFTIRCLSDILRIRWESSRTRTKERALLMMDNLVKRIYESSPPMAERIAFSYAVYMPSIPALRKEYGLLLVRCGLIGEAVKEFEDLELWDNLIYCYSLLEKKATAVELIRKCLSERPNDPRLWCSLGDTTTNDACYEKALEVSNNKSARAKRSLARSAYNKGDYETSKILWESAMSMNSLYPDGWFALGATALKARDIQKALDAFTRAVQLDPENGEAWNNIACLHMIKKKSKEAFISFKEALKFKRNSWQLWENYSHVAVDVGNISQALEGIRMVLDMTDNKRVDTELLERITREVENRLRTSNLSPLTTNNNPETDQVSVSGSENQQQLSGASLVGTSRETEQLLLLLGKVLQQIVKSGSGCGPDVWGLYAKWHRINGDLMMCSEALLKQVRSLQGSDTWNDRDRFKKFAKASLELCQVYVEISSSTGSIKQLFTAEMHLKNVVRQAQSFSDTEEFRDLQACYDEVKVKLNSMPS
ncbi:tetratricopeptide repeat protein 27 homolog isoform X1 [Abrus precatorius]|uniref:Tetratricopeptide repeat protein 27 homolog isoform X1 n=1 Tax=Abrus precatorius TaxID=3816 RepID=A0A8B8KIK1_ABRPR|nr:tetratricopeptide repeat protein 27 homolog isoform X1 [Abrus precatorius]